MTHIRVAGLILAGLFATNANATLITFNAADYADGTDATHLSPGLTIRSISAAPVPVGQAITVETLGVHITHTTHPLLPPGFFTGTGSYWGGALTELSTGYACLGSLQSTYCNEGFSMLELTFDTPTDFIELIGGWSDTDSGTYIAFNAAGDRLGCDASTPDHLRGTCAPLRRIGDGQYASSMTNEFGISRVLFGAMFPAGVVAMGSISYNVPEPATWLLFGAGLLGLAVGGRKRQRA